MKKAVLFVAIGLVLIGLAGLTLFPNVRADIFEKLPFFKQTPKAITLKYWGIWEPREVIQPLLDQYQKENPTVTIEYEQRDPSDYDQLINTRFGVEGSADIARVHATWVPYLASKIAPISDKVLTTEEYERIFYQVNAQFLKKDKKYYAIPLMVDGLSLVYNKSIFTEANITKPPTDWNQFRENARLLTKRNSDGEIVQAGAALGYADNIDYFADIIGLMFAQNGVQFADDEGTVTFQSSVSPVGGNLAVEALKFYTLFATTEKSWNPDWDNSTDEFARGKVAMILVPSHRLHQILGMSPTFAIGVAPVPQLPVTNTSVGNVGWANYWVETVSKSSPNTQEAWRFLKWMAQKDQLVTMYKVASNVRAFGEPYPRVDMASALNGDAFTLPYVQQGSVYKTWYFASGVINARLNDPIITALKSMVNDVVGGESVEGTLNKTAKTIQGTIDTAAKQ